MANDALLSSVLELGWSSYQSISVDRWQNGVATHVDDFIAEEVPVVLMYNGVSHEIKLNQKVNREKKVDKL
jgi:FdhD protein